MKSLIALTMAGMFLLVPTRTVHLWAAEGPSNAEAEYKDFATPGLAADVAYQRGEWDVAIKYFTKAMEAKATPEEEVYESELMIASCYFHKDNPGKALGILESLEGKVRASTTVNKDGQKLSTLGLGRIAARRAAILHSSKRYKEAIESYKSGKGYYSAAVGQIRALPEDKRGFWKEASALGIDRQIAECSLEDGQDAKKVADMFRQLQPRYESYAARIKGSSWMRTNEDLECQYISRVYLNKRLGDCLHNKSHYKAALETYPGVPDDLRKSLSAEGLFVKKETLDALSRGIEEPKSSDQETTGTKDVTTSTLKVVGGCGSGCGSGAETASAQRAAKPAGSSASGGGCGCGSPQPAAAKLAESSASGGSCGCGSPAPREAARQPAPRPGATAR